MNDGEGYAVVSTSLASRMECVKQGSSAAQGRYIKMTDREKQLAVADVSGHIAIILKARGHGGIARDGPPFATCGLRFNTEKGEI